MKKMWMIIQIVLLLTVVGTKCQKVTLDALQPLSPCTSGLRTGVDRFVINGIVAGNVAGYLVSGWENTIYIEVLKKASGKITLCPIAVTKASCSNPNRVLQCYCNDVDSTTGEVHVVINYTAVIDLSQGIIRAQWRNSNSALIFSNNQTLPEMYDVAAAQLIFTASNASGNLATPGSCDFSLTLSKLSSLRLCCDNTATPCYPKISFRGDVVSGISCVSYPTSKLPSAGVTGHLVLSLSLCNQPDYVPEGRCTMPTIPEKQKSDDNKTLTICLAVIIPCVVIIAVGVGLWCYWRRKVNEESQLSGHTNQAFDERW